MHILYFYLQLLSAGFAIAAAWFWWKSARVEVPAEFPPSVGYSMVGGMTKTQNEGLEKLGPALYKQSLWSAKAAGLAGASALIQSITIIMSVHM